MLKSVNVGSVDQVIRIILGFVPLVLPYSVRYELCSDQYVSYGMGAVGVVLILTALVRLCPLYRLIGASTCKVS